MPDFFSCCSVAKSCLTLCDPTDCSMQDLPVPYHLSEFAQTHVLWLGDAIQPSHPLSSPSPPAFNLSQHHGLFQWINSFHQVAKVLELQLQHQFLQYSVFGRIRYWKHLKPFVRILKNYEFNFFKHIRLSRFSISSHVSIGNLCLLRNLFVSSKLLD